ncbi:MAG: type II secretion system F family protein [Pseudomonadota bacterium]|nr:type II secretion system F family protein [Pseudomonadota bacterium]
MPSFTYKARNTRGELLTGKLEGGSEAAVADELLRSGLTPVDITGVAAQSDGEAGQDIGQYLGHFFAEKVGEADLMLFCRQMASLLKAGVPILRALASLAESSAHKTFRVVLLELREGLSSGRELSACLRKHPTVFQSFFVNMVRVGETTGRLDDVFMRLFHHLEFEREMRERVKSALRYPSFVVAALVIALGVINVMVIPAFAKVYKSSNAELPLMTKVLIGTSDFTVAWWPLLLGGMVVAGLVFRWWLKTARGEYLWDKILLSVPIVGKIVHKAALARFAKGLGMTYQSGVPIVQGLTNAAQVVGNAFIASRIEQMRDGVERGESLTRTATTTGVFTPVVLQMMAVGEETGELDRLLTEIGELYQRDVEYEIRTLSEQIEPILITGLGAIVLVVALGVFLPIWDLGSTMTKK